MLVALYAAKVVLRRLTETRLEILKHWAWDAMPVYWQTRARLQMVLSQVVLLPDGCNHEQEGVNGQL